MRRHEPAAGEKTLTTNQVIAYNFARAREEKGWRQVEASERLEPFLGYRLNQAGVSSIERSFESDRQRNFSATELVAFARCFDKTIGYFMLPPPGLGRHFLDPVEGSSWMRVHDLAALVLGVPGAWRELVDRLSEWLDTDAEDAWTALRYAFHDRSDGAQPADVLDEWVGARRRELQAEMLAKLSSEVDDHVHEVVRLAKQLEELTMVGLLKRVHDDPALLLGLAERPNGEVAPGGGE